MSPLGKLRCEHSSHEQAVGGNLDSEGKWRSATSAAYPPEFNFFLARGITALADTHAASLVAPAARPVLPASQPAKHSEPLDDDDEPDADVPSSPATTAVPRSGEVPKVPPSPVRVDSAPLGSLAGAFAEVAGSGDASPTRRVSFQSSEGPTRHPRYTGLNGPRSTAAASDIGGVDGRPKRATSTRLVDADGQRAFNYFAKQDRHRALALQRASPLAAEYANLPLAQLQSMLADLEDANLTDEVAR
jgi:hypothetical protein